MDNSAKTNKPQSFTTRINSKTKRAVYTTKHKLEPSFSLYFMKNDLGYNIPNENIFICSLYKLFSNFLISLSQLEKKHFSVKEFYNNPKNVLEFKIVITGRCFSMSLDENAEIATNGILPGAEKRILIELPLISMQNLNNHSDFLSSVTFQTFYSNLIEQIKKVYSVDSFAEYITKSLTLKTLSTYFFSKIAETTPDFEIEKQSKNELFELLRADTQTAEDLGSGEMDPKFFVNNFKTEKFFKATQTFSKYSYGAFFISEIIFLYLSAEYVFVAGS